MAEFISNSYEETLRLGGELAVRLKAGDVVALRGGLGAGKTAFARGLITRLIPEADPVSPTFAIVNTFEGGGFSVCHFDMYRITSEEALYSAGFYDYIDKKNIIVIEWYENIEKFFGGASREVSIEPAGENKRRITIT